MRKLVSQSVTSGHIDWTSGFLEPNKKFSMLKQAKVKPGVKGDEGAAAVVAAEGDDDDVK